MKRSNALGALAALALPSGITGIGLADEAPAATSSAEAAGVVGREIDAFNAHDAVTVAKMHAPDAVFTLLPSGKVLASGFDQLSAFFTNYFKQTPNAKLRLEKQYVLKNVVVNHYAGGDVTSPGTISIYEVKNGLIANEWLITG
jgi:hypothetical protein